MPTEIEIDNVELSNREDPPARVNAYLCGGGGLTLETTWMDGAMKMRQTSHTFNRREARAFLRAALDLLTEAP